MNNVLVRFPNLFFGTIQLGNLNNNVHTPGLKLGIDPPRNPIAGSWDVKLWIPKVYPILSGGNRFFSVLL